MMEAQTKLRIVAGLFAVWGVLALVGMFRFSEGKIQVSASLGVLCIPIALGLLTARAVWRRAALVFLVLSLVLVAVAVALVVFQWKSIRVMPSLGLSVAGTAVIGAILLIGSAALSLWAIGVLRTPAVRKLFGEGVQRIA